MCPNCDQLTGGPAGPTAARKFIEFGILCPLSLTVSSSEARSLNGHMAQFALAMSMSMRLTIRDPLLDLIYPHSTTFNITLSLGSISLSVFA